MWNYFHISQRKGYVMKLSWNDVSKYFAHQNVWTTENEQYWYRHIWELLGDNHLSEYHTTAEKVAVYARIYGIIKIHRDFCYHATGENPDFLFCPFPEELYEDENIVALADNDGSVRYLIEEDEAVKSIFAVLSRTLGAERTFASMWVTFDSDIEEDFDDYSAYIKYLNSILNHDITTGKGAAYEYLCENMAASRASV